MRTRITPPHAFLNSQTFFKLVLAMFFIFNIANGIHAQSATTFTATNAQISGTLTSGTRLDANCMHVQDTIHADGGIVSGQDVDIQGNLHVTGNIVTTSTSTATLGSVITNGPTIFNSSVSIPSFSSTGNSQLLIDSQGNLFKGTEPPPSLACIPSSAPWVLGGNFVLSVPLLNSTIGTCDNADFALKANNLIAQQIKPDGSIGFGTNVPSNSGTKEFKFKNGPIKLQGTSNFGGPQIVFDGGLYPYGDWGLEYTTATTTIGGLNFWKPALSPNSFNNLFFIGDNGHIGVGTGNLPARFNVDAWSGDGIFVKTATANNKVFRNMNTATNSENTVIYGDGRVKLKPGTASSSVENSLNPVLYVRNDNTNAQNVYKAGIVVECPGQFANATGNYWNSGVLVVSDNFAATAYGVYNSASNKTLFRVTANGKTNIGDEFASPAAYLLTVNGKIGAREIKVSIQNPWPDYVFDKSYKLISLDVLEKYIATNKRLPNIPSAKELKSEECGLNLGEMLGLQMEKIEDIYLYLIEMNKEIKELKKENEELKKLLKK